MATAFSRGDAGADTRPLAGIDAVILAGGFGTRLRPVLPDRQKVLADVNGAPFVKKLIDFYTAAGVDRIVLALGYRAADVEEFIAHNSGTAEVIASVESEPLGTGGALRFALPKLRSKTVLVANGDSFADVDFAALLRLHRAKQSEITLALAFVTDMRRYGRVIMGDDSVVTGFEEKAGADGPIEAGYVNSGVYLVEQGVVAALPAGRRLSLELDVFPRMIGKLYALPQRIPFIDIGTPETWAAANDFFAEIEKRKVRP